MPILGDGFFWEWSHEVHFLQIEKKDKEIQLQTESISQITQMLQKTKKELEVRVNNLFTIKNSARFHAISMAWLS